MSLRLRIALAFVAAACAAAQQPNTPFAAMKIDGQDGPNYPMSVSVRRNTTSTVAVSGAVNARFLTCVSATGQVAPASTTVFGDQLDLPSVPPPIPWLNGYYGPGVGVFLTGPLGVKTVPVPVPASYPLGMTIGLQTAMDDPSSPFGVSLTAATAVTVAEGPTITTLAFSPGGDEGFSTVVLPAGMTFPFYGVSYTRLHVCTNGYVVPSNAANAPTADFTPTAAEFAANQPRIALFWCDQDLSNAVCTATIDLNPPGLAPFVTVAYQAAADYGVGGTIHSYSCTVDTAGNVAIVHPFHNSASVFYVSLTGIGPGGSLGPAATQPKDLSALDTNTYVGAPFENFFEMFQSSQGNAGFSIYDLQGRTLTFLPIGGGVFGTNAYYLP
jgi:hypothetical protein